jgi:hypothetical protein
MRELLTFLKHKERDRFGKVSRRGQAKRKLLGRNKKRFISKGIKCTILLEVSQALPACPSGSGKKGKKTLRR